MGAFEATASARRAKPPLRSTWEGGWD